MSPDRSPFICASRRLGVVLLCAALLCAPRSAIAQSTPPAPSPPVDPAPIAGTARIDGRVLQADGKTPEAGAVIRVCSLETDTAVGSAVADGKGEFHLEGLGHGFVEIVVSAADVVFAGNQVVQLAPEERKSLELVLVPTPEAPRSIAGRSPRASACAERPPTGSAEIRPKTGTGQFLRSKKGIATLVGAGAAALLLLSSGGSNDEPPASPSTP